MNVELIPVVEISYFDNDITTPQHSPYWLHPDEWQAYHDRCHEHAGFKDKFLPYYKGSGLYRLQAISDNNLIKIINDHLSTSIGDELFLEECEPLLGGYVLKIGGENKLFPQCCSDLSDIVSWGALINGKKELYNGHPSPEIDFKNENIIFRCNDEYESFVPETDKEIIVSNEALKNAYHEAIVELEAFKKTIQRITPELHYQTKIPLENILIYNR